MTDRGAKQHFSTQLLQVTDAILVWFAFILAAIFRSPLREILGRPGQDGPDLQGMMWVIFIAVPATPLILERFGHYDRLLTKNSGQIFNGLFRGMLMVGLVIGAVSIFGQFNQTRRLALGFGFIFVFVFLWIRCHFTVQFLRKKARSEGGMERIVLVGSKKEISKFLEEIGLEETQTWNIVGHISFAEQQISDLADLISRESVQRVIFLSKHTEFERVARAVELCEIQGVEAWIGATFLKTQVARPSFDIIGGQPMLVFRSTPELSWQLFAKRLVDIFGALGITLLSLPLWVIAWLGIRFSSPGAPTIFTQQRAGLYGKPFQIYKFRTMVPDAEAKLNEIKEKHGNEVDGPAFKLEGDPRIFRFGQFLRNFSIDELPQMINVLKGEMSLVGPRPLPLHEIEAIDETAHRRRLSMKPGITCLWQIGGRSNITNFDEWVKLDVEYIDRWSIWEDFRILLKTIPAVLFSKGAR